MAAVGRLKDSFFITAPSAAIDPVRLIQKVDDIFGVYDRFGDILPVGKKEQGLYYRGTRFLSHFELRIDGQRPLFLSSNIDGDNVLMTVDLTNPDIYSAGRLRLRRDAVHILRSRLLSGNSLVEHIRVRNFGGEGAAFTIELGADADFEDIFEVRGMKRLKRGAFSEPEYLKKGLRLAYTGLDGVVRSSSVSFSRAPESSGAQSFEFAFDLKPGEGAELVVSAACVEGEEGARTPGFQEALAESKKRVASLRRAGPIVAASNDRFNVSVTRALSDIDMMLTSTGHGLFPYGGIPWFCTPFGRDGLITAIECLWLRPELAKGVLRYLAARQAGTADRRKAAEPGKILHESRHGEMAALDEIPFGLYYGSVDSTPLFLMLAGQYWRRTADTPTIKRLWRSIEAAIGWMERYGDQDGDGFLEYAPHAKGLRNQGWKDSQDSVFHADGTLAEGPIALCEVQAYAYAAKKEAAFLCRLLGKASLAGRLSDEADELQKRFNDAFWDEELSTFILALDGDKRPCRVVSSNAGHALFCGIAYPDRARRVADTLMSEEMFSGWGIRTVGAGEARYNPMSYHNGSVWPHDNALIACGMASYGFFGHFERVFAGIFDASLHMELQRLPELFCGFHRRDGAAPTHYPVACSPQTWASGALLLMLQASLGIHFEAGKGIVIFKQPELPDFLASVYLKNLMVKPKKGVDILVSRFGEDVTVEALKKPHDINILIIK